MKNYENLFKFYYILGLILQKLNFDIKLSENDKRFLDVVDDYDFLIEYYEEELEKRVD